MSARAYFRPYGLSSRRRSSVCVSTQQSTDTNLFLPPFQDYLTYLTHRMYHTPFLYKHFHKLHHTYKQPTAFSVTAIHPVEFVHVQLILISPMFFVPVHWGKYGDVVAMNWPDPQRAVWCAVAALSRDL